jgi:hypothetical protein
MAFQIKIQKPNQVIHCPKASKLMTLATDNYSQK